MSASATDSVRAFLSYSWDSPQHKERVLDLAQQLRRDGVDARLDQFTPFPEEGWERWMAAEIAGATFVLVIVTERYSQRFAGNAPAGTGLGATWEGAVITQDLYEAGARNKKFLPVLFSETDIPHTPKPLRSFTRFCIDTDAGYKALYRQITGQPEIVPAPLGKVQKLPSGTRRGITESPAPAPLPPLPIPETHVAEEVMRGVGLCLSGGGYRAMLFHAGVLWRLNEIGYLPKLERVASVSGGSITAAVLGRSWKNLNFDAGGVGESFDDEVVRPIRELASHTIQTPTAISGSAPVPGAIAAAAYDRYLFHEASLQDLPDTPRFLINATNLQSGALWRFSKEYMADYRVGRVDNPNVSLAVAVAASSAFPPFMSPVELELPRGLVQPTAGADLHEQPYTTDVVLTDGGVYDNLGLETIWKIYRTVLVSDAGARMQGEAEPERDWAQHAFRVLSLVDNQVRSLRKRQVVDSYERREREGAYWGIRTNISDYGLPTALSCPFERTAELAKTPTRLQHMSDELQERLINWGYAVCDAAMRKHITLTLPVPRGFPYPAGGV